MGGKRGEGDNDVDLCCREFGGIRRQQCRVAIGKASLDRDIAPLGPAERAHTLAEIFQPLRALRRAWDEHPDTRHPRNLLSRDPTGRRSGGEDRH